LYPSPAQEVVLLEQCAHARYVWNLGLEQRLMWRRWQGPTPGYNGQAAQLTEARAANPWLAEGSQTVQQQALRVRQDNRRWSGVLVPKVGWVQVRRSRALPGWKSYRITRDRAGRWHIAFAAIPDPIPAPGTGQVVGLDRGVKSAVALSTGELSSPAGLRPKEAERLLRLQRRLARAQRGSNRRAALKVQIAAYTSQTCNDPAGQFRRASKRADEGDRRIGRCVLTLSSSWSHDADVLGSASRRGSSMWRSMRGIGP
jgi:hypothetical protein